MDVKGMLSLLRENLNNNLWKIVNGEAVRKFDFNKYMNAVFEDATGGKAIGNNKHFIENRAEEIRGNYNKTLNEINKEIKHGNILREKQKLKKKVNDEFRKDIKRFVSECEKR